ncbi:MAG: hypothetical protein DCF30_21100 [Hyphomicrobiales bacterium]|nr:MAG: hypothetical protein DCF30_21100 [Hyphomicrobiales bacterium]
MAAAVKLRTDYSAFDLRRLAAGSRHANQSRRLLSLAAVLDGMDREQAARIGGMDRQTLRDWVHRFNEGGPDGLKDIRSKGHRPGSRSISSPPWRPSSRPAPTGLSMAWCAGGASICKRSSLSASASIITSARSGSF